MLRTALLCSVTQSCLALHGFMDCSPPGFSVHGIFQARNMGGGDLVAKSCPTLVTPWTIACWCPLYMRFSRHEYWSGVPLPSLNPSRGHSKYFIFFSCFRSYFIDALQNTASQVFLVVKNPPANAGRHKSPRFNPWVRKIPWRRKWQPSLVFLPGVPRTEGPEGLQSMGSQKVGHD